VGALVSGAKAVKLPTDRNSLAFLYMACARQEGVQPVLAPDGTLVGLQGPERALARYNARMATLQPPATHRPKRSVRRRLYNASRRAHV
jgi:hypothetical protein